MPCDIEQLLEDGKAFQFLTERAQAIVIAQLLCDISQNGGGALSPFTITTITAPAFPWQYTATRRSTVEIYYKLDPVSDDARIIVARTGAPNMEMMCSIYQEGVASFQIGPGNTITVTDGSTLPGVATLAQIAIYEE